MFWTKAVNAKLTYHLHVKLKNVFANIHRSSTGSAHSSGLSFGEPQNLYRWPLSHYTWQFNQLLQNMSGAAFCQNVLITQICVSFSPNILRTNQDQTWTHLHFYANIKQLICMMRLKLCRWPFASDPVPESWVLNNALSAFGLPNIFFPQNFLCLLDKWSLCISEEL